MRGTTIRRAVAMAWCGAVIFACAAGCSVFTDLDTDKYTPVDAGATDAALLTVTFYGACDGGESICFSLPTVPPISSCGCIPFGVPSTNGVKPPNADASVDGG
jgi:hypothetical protein